MIELRRNLTKEKLAEGEIVTVTMGPMSADLVEHFGPVGIDALWFEAEHGPVDFGDIPNLTRACDLWNITSIVRVHQNEPGVIYRTLDLGAQGVVIPHVNTAEEAVAVVDAAKFAPIGHRGNFTSRQGIGVTDYFLHANEVSLVIVLIEDIVAVDNLDAILEVDHIDVLLVAPGDLAQSMGYPGGAGRSEVTAVVEESIRRINVAGRVAGTLVNSQNVDHYVAMGARFLTVNWVPWLQQATQDFISKVGRGLHG